MRRLFPILFAVSILVIGAFPAFAIDPPHDDAGSSDCSLCHTFHNAQGGALTLYAGNANLCQSCHVTPGGPAAALPFVETDQALPGPGLPAGDSPSGTSHRWDSGPGGHATADAGNTSTGTVESGGAFTGPYPKTYTITISTAGDVGAALFDWAATAPGGGSDTNVTTGTDVVLDEGVTVTFSDGVGSPSFLVSDEWNVYVRTDLNDPSDVEMLARLEGDKIMCSTCHNEHSQLETPFDPAAPAYGGAGTGDGRHFQRIDNDLGQMCAECHTPRDVGTLASQGTGNLSHPVGVPIPGGDYQAPVTLPLDASSNVSCLSCHAMHDPDGSKGLPDNGTLARLSDTVALCSDCHTLTDTVTPASHVDAVTGVLWPGGEYGSPPSNYPAITDEAMRGSCVNCHQPHGWPDAATPSQDYDKLLVERGGDSLCFTCHDSTGPGAVDIYGAFNGSTNYQDTALDGALINQRHDVSAADQAYSGGVVGCPDCHNPHLATGAAPTIDPDTPTTAFGQTYDKTNSYTRDGYNFTYASGGSDLDPMNPIGCTGQAAAVGAAVEGVHNGDDLGTSGGTYSGGVDQTYTVTVSTGGAPPAAQITVTSTGPDSSGPTTVTAFDTPVVVGTLGATISFNDGGSGGTPPVVGPAVDPAPANDDTAASGGSYGGTVDGTYTVTVTTGGRERDAVVTCTGLECGGGTIVCQPTGSGGPECAYDAPFAVGGNGVTITISENARDFTAGDDWTIAVTAASGDGVLTLNDTWTIAATAATAGCSTDPEPDMVTLCLVCHDNNPPAGVTMSPNLLNIADAYRDSDQHGRIDGTGGGNGYMKAPWQDVVANGDGTWANAELSNPYAALQCNICHDGHGSANLFHLKTSINVRGIQMTVGGGAGSGLEVSDGFTSFGSTTYILPCFDGGGGQVDCSTPGSTQLDHKWGGFCSFCHDMQSHGRAEADTCRTGHKHGGGSF